MTVGDILARLRPMRRELELAASFEAPIRAEVFGIERLETFARALAESDGVDPRLRGRPLLRRFHGNRRMLLQAQRRFAADARQGRALPPAAEWLLDNFYIIQDHLHQIEHDLSSGYYRELPKLTAGPQAGYPRVYGLALELLGHTDSRLDAEVITRFVQAYQAVAPLNSGELWAVAIMLRIGLVENLRRLINQSLVAHQRRQAAGEWAGRVLRLAAEADGVAGALGELSQGVVGLDSAFVVNVLERLRDQSPAIAPVVQWLELWLSERGSNLDVVTRAEHQVRASNRLSVANVVTSLKVLATVDWPEFFESTSLLERQLRLDPLGVYAGMDFDTRDRYRHVVERLSRGARLEETEVARRALAQARRYLVGQAGEVKPEADLGALREAHVGYYLVDAGRPGLERDLGYKPRLDEALRGAAMAHPGLVYLGSIAALTTLFVWLALAYAARHGLGALGLAGLALLSLLPASALAVNTANYWATMLLPPASLPKLDFKAGVPAAFRTMVVVPALLSDVDGLQRLFDNLEIRCLANRDPYVHFALLCDFSDAPNHHQPEDAGLLEAAARMLAELNDRHGQDGNGPFYFFNRERTWNAGEGVWMGWERKRGKLLEFNRLLRGAKDTHYTTRLGDQSVLRQVCLVIDLDADTDLPINTARRLVGAMAHPLNRPRLEREARLVVAGYGILQPRVAVNALAATQTRFSRLFAGETGLDPYSAAVSTVYQDLFGRGNYIGKAIYDVDTALAVLDNRFPENLLLSHDLLEGGYVRAGQVTEIQLLEDFPTGYDTFMQRQHRWTRGDWQITDWLLPRVPAAGGRRLTNPLPLIARWQIFDNLRISLVPAATVALLALSWSVLPGSALAWTAAALLPMYLNELLGLVLSSAVHPPGEPWLAYVRGVTNDAALSLGRIFFQIACLPHAALVNLDAIGRVFARRMVTHRGLLEWTSAAAAEGGQARRLSGFWVRMWPAAALALVLLALVAAAMPARLPAALPLAAAWLLAPFAAYWLNQPGANRAGRPLPAAAHAELRRIARRIWHFYEIFAGPEDNWLPPDNFQLQPSGTVAHRTSPTNIGFLMLSALAAHDFGYLDGGSLLDRLEQTFVALEKLQRFHGHLLNWYQTQTLRALSPEYVSTVDSGNLAACLLVVKQACLQTGAWLVAPPSGLSGLRDTLAELVLVIRGYPTQPPAARSAAKELLAAAEGLLQSLPADGAGPGWLRGLERIEREASALGQQAQSLAATPGAPDAGPLIGWTELLLAQVRGWRRWVDQVLPSDAAGDQTLDQAAAVEGPVAVAARELTARSAALAARAEALVAGMDFAFLFSQERGVFSIGYNLPAQALDNSFYDLLASECRLASLVAVARGQVPARHWFRLGRPLTWAGDSLAVLSWGGTMFEYLMPSLLAHDYPATLLEQTARAVVGAQRRFGEVRRAPWGVSESGFYAFDYQLNYQYQSFGVPELALRRDQGNNLVVAPYATFLALHVDPPAAWDNLQRLAREGAAGPYGYFEALDYTPSRRPRGQGVAVVASFMAHHQGMSLVALDNYLNGGPMPRRFHSEASIAAVELLLQERVPRHVPVLEPHPEGEADPGIEGRPLDGERSASVRWFSTPHTPTPRTHVLSNSSYEVMVTNAGGGYSHYNDPVSGRTVAVTRWRPDITLDNWGTFIYLQDTASGQTWSATYQPTAREPDGYEASYSVDRVEFRRRDLGIESHLEIVVSPRDNIEIRRVTLTNRSRRPRALALTSFAELVLDTPEADLAHPAFGKLFVESEYLDERHALLFRRRPRAAGQPHPWALHLVVADRPFTGPVEYETDRARFLGRGQTVRRPAALRGPLSNTAGAVLDPVMSLRATLKLAPAESATVVFVTGVGADREAVLALADKYHDPRIVASTQELAWVYSQIQLRHLNITDEEAHLYQRLASRMLYPDAALRAPAEILMQNRRGQSALWAYGLSGDNPILLVELDEDGELDLARQLLRAHEYWRLNNFVVDLVILNEHATSYAEGLEGQLRVLINTSLSHPYLDRPGGVFVRRADQMPTEDLVLLKTVAQVVLDADAGTLLEQIERSVRESGAAEPMAAPQRVEPAAAAVAVAAATRAARQFDNGLGGFSADGREYVITLAGDEWTPMPWANVLANESFGCLVSEAGLGCTWSENSQQNRLTPWSNDPVRDPAGEAIYVRDEATGEAWTPTPLPMRAEDGAAYTIAHGAGYTRYEHTRHDLAQELVVFVPPADPVKVMRLRLRNLGRQARAVSVTGYAEWVLGVTRVQSQHFVITERDSHSGALLARNRYNTAFAERVAFAQLSAPGPERRTQRGNKAPVPERRVRRGGQAPATLAYTTDRTEFIGRNRSLAQPAGLEGGTLSGRVGAGLDPCAALQATVTINPREMVELVFLVGQAANAEQAGALIARYSEAAEVERSLQANHALWDDLLGAVQVRTPDPALDLMLNRWLLYQATVCRIWGRTAFYQSGGAYGFRDQLQDVLALLHARPDLARAHLLRAAARQFVQGDVQHWWHPTTGQGVRTRFSDDFLWLPYAVANYVSVTGDAAVLDEAVPYLEAPPLGPDEHEAFISAATTTETGSLYEHCTRALDHGLRFGAHGLPLMGIGDWNDGMNRVGEKGRGESVWLGWFLLANLQSFGELARQRGDIAAAERYEQAAPPLAQALEEHGWDGQWYRRAYFDDGTPLGSAQNEECQIDSIAQSWAVISGGAPPDRASQALASADERLVLPEARLSRLLTPPFNRSQPDPGYIQGYIPGTRENGGQYTHAALWLVLAHAMQGNAERAAELYAMANPINHALTAEDAARYKVEPYVIAADIYAHPEHLGRGGWTWYTGSASWMYRVGLEGLLGLRRRGTSLSFEPCLPKAWPGFELTYRFGKTHYEIRVENGAGGKVVQMELDGRKVDGAALPLVDDGRAHTVRVKLGTAA